MSSTLRYRSEGFAKPCSSGRQQLWAAGGIAHSQGMGPYPDRRQPDRGYELKPFSKLDEATVSYFTEVRTHLKGVEDPEERSLLASNALAEIKGGSSPWLAVALQS